VVMEVIVGEMLMAMPLAAAPTRTAVPAAASGEMPTANWTGEVTTTHVAATETATHVAAETTAHWTGEVTTTHVAATETATHVAATTAEASAATAVSSVRLLHGGRSNKQAACKSSNCNKYSRFHDEPPKLRSSVPRSGRFLALSIRAEEASCIRHARQKSRNKCRWPLLIVIPTPSLRRPL